ncbi:hypothetical protein [Nostoc sp. CMAA1605]|uniref:hypothetical protein n=1 Tax=Nostoc sp. CMAA1605 TaxID=2055159 RepID=UPI001F2039FD|nr:hypothetical protein [Nostoc sp. CMAA1605]
MLHRELQDTQRTNPYSNIPDYFTLRKHTPAARRRNNILPPITRQVPPLRRDSACVVDNFDCIIFREQINVSHSRQLSVVETYIPHLKDAQDTKLFWFCTLCLGALRITTRKWKVESYISYQLSVIRRVI